MPATDMRFATGGDLLVEVLRSAGVDTAFGVVSIHNIPLVQAVSAQLRFVPTRDEAAAVNAADGYARARGGLGCAITSTGTGAGNAAGSMIEALTARSAVLHITGQIPTEHLGRGRGFIHETPNQEGLLAAVSSRVYTVTTADDAAPILHRAAAEAAGRGDGPVSVQWPIDLQFATSGRDAAPWKIPAPPSVDDAQIVEAARLLAKAQRPAVWVGGGATGAGVPLRELVEHTGAALFTSNAGRGVVPEDHPLCVGNYATSREGQALLDDADLMLSIGTHFRSNETDSYRLRLPATHIQVDVDPAAFNRTYSAKAVIHGDAQEALLALLERLGNASNDGFWSERVGRVRHAVREAHRQTIGPHAAVCDAIRSALPREGIIARDVTIASSSWGNRLLPVYDHRSNIFARGGGIGQGLAMGIGAAVGRPGTPVVVMVGDGGLAAHLGELLTLSQERLNVTVILFNDRGYGVLRNLQDSQGVPHAGVDLHTPDFSALTAACDLPYSRITDVASLDALGRSIAATGPAVVEVDLDALGPMNVPFVPPSGSADDDWQPS